MKLVCRSLLAMCCVFIFVPAQGQAQNCSCPKKPELEESYADSSVVFLGQVENQEDSVVRPEYIEVRLAVQRKFKWLNELSGSQSIVVYTPPEQAKCGYPFQNGFDYLVFAKGNPAFLRVDSCSRTNVVENSQLDREKLQRLMKPNQ